MRKIILLSCPLLLLACKSKSDSEIVNLDDIIPTSEQYDGKQQTEQLSFKPYNSIIPLASFHKNGGLMLDSVSGFDEIHFLDRFENEEMDKFIAHQGEKETRVWVYQFKKGKANNAFVNWLNCFGTRCEQIDLMDENYRPAEQMTIWQNDETIIVVDKAIRSEKEQLQWLNSFRLEFGLNWNYQLVLQKGKAIAWTKDIELKEI